MTKIYRLINRYMITCTINSTLVPSGNDTLPMLFDTGACVTVISPSYVFSKEVMRLGRSTIADVFSKVKKSRIRSFHENGLEMSICCFNDVVIGNLRFDKFYALVPEYSESNFCVLGFDFIDSCDCSSIPGGDIDILNFDYDKYYKYWDKRISEEGVITRDDFVFSMQQESSYAGYHVGDSVIYTNEDFDTIIPERLAVVKEVFVDHMIITELDTNTDLWIQDGLNLDQVKRRKVTGASALRGK